MKKTIQHPANKDQWRDKLRNFSMKIGFQLTLSKAMLEMLCAIADDVWWDRALYPTTNGFPDNWIAPINSLEKRGLIQRKPQDEIDGRKHANTTHAEWCEWHHYGLTPAGECVVSLLKLAGLFVEADAAINKKSKMA